MLVVRGTFLQNSQPVRLLSVVWRGMHWVRTDCGNIRGFRPRSWKTCDSQCRCPDLCRGQTPPWKFTWITMRPTRWFVPWFENFAILPTNSESCRLLHLRGDLWRSTCRGGVAVYSVCWCTCRRCGILCVLQGQVATKVYRFNFMKTFEKVLEDNGCIHVRGTLSVLFLSKTRIAEIWAIYLQW